jgi:predicted SprT family Zn-dependent metalloprotease
VLATDVLGIALHEQVRARSIIAGLGPCPVVLSRATTLLGSFTVDTRTGRGAIRISRYILDPEQVRDTARHELAHQAAYELHGHLGHGPLWQTWARYLGCLPVSCSQTGIDPDIADARQRYMITCRACGWTTTRQRRSRLVRQPRRYACGRCAGSLLVEPIVASSRIIRPLPSPGS